MPADPGTQGFSCLAEIHVPASLQEIDDRPVLAIESGMRQIKVRYSAPRHLAQIGKAWHRACRPPGLS